MENRQKPGARSARILRLIARLNVGGPARHVIWLTSRLDPRFERVLLSGRVEPNEAELSDFAASEGVSVEYIEGFGRSIGPRDLLVFPRVLAAAWRHRPDIIHTHTSKAGLHGRAAAFVLRLLGRRIKVVHTFHGHVLEGYFSPPVTAFFRALERFLGHCATDRVVTISEQQFAELRDRFRVAQAEKFRLIPIAIDPSPFTFRDEPIDPARLRIGFVGRLTAIKNPLLFLEAAARVRTRIPGARTIIFGDGELRSAMEKVAPEGAEFRGNRTDMPAVMREFDLLVLSSENEGTPVAVLEAFASGVPVVATKAGGLVDLLAEGRGGLVEKGDAAGLADGILRIVGDPELASRMRQSARAYFERRHTLRRLVGDIESLYDELLDENRVGRAD